jgi:hypothetical protein
LLAVLAGFALRLLPEVLAYPYPIGYDTVHYVAVVQNGFGWPHWTSLFSTWLLYAMLHGIHQLSQVDPFLLVKVAAPVLFALNAGGIYYFANKALEWDAQKSFVAAGLFVVQLAAFRLSWDLLRNTLGMAIVLFALPFVMKPKSRKDFAVFALLSLLVAFTHELASVVLLVVVFFGIVLKKLLNRDRAKLLKVSAAILPAAVVFLASVYFTVVPPQIEVATNVISTVQPVSRPAGLFFLADYFAASRSGVYVSYFDLASQVLSVFIVLYLLCLPLVCVGFFRDDVLDVWTLFLACASFSCLVVPFLALDAWDRWLLLLVYPFTFYAVRGVIAVFRSAGGAVRPACDWLQWMKVSKVTTVTLLSGMILLTSCYIGTTLQSDNYVVFSVPTISRYFSVAPIVPLEDVADTVEVMEWLDGNMNDGSCVLVHSTFLSWARLGLDGDHVILKYSSDVDEALSVANTYGFRPVYLVWWAESIGWYWFSVPSDFTPVYVSGRMATFQYSG